MTITLLIVPLSGIWTINDVQQALIESKLVSRVDLGSSWAPSSLFSAISDQGIELDVETTTDQFNDWVEINLGDMTLKAVDLSVWL